MSGGGAAPPPRDPGQRKRDVLDRLDRDVDAWIATAGEEAGTPYMIPLSFLWDGETIVIATPTASPTARNLLASGKVRVGAGLTRDVVLIEAVVDRATPATDVPGEVGDAFAAKSGFDPRELRTPYHYFHLRPLTLKAWREANELAGRDLIRDGRWLVD